MIRSVFIPVLYQSVSTRGSWLRAGGRLASVPQAFVSLCLKAFPLFPLRKRAEERRICWEWPPFKNVNEILTREKLHSSKSNKDYLIQRKKSVCKWRTFHVFSLTEIKKKCMKCMCNTYSIFALHLHLFICPFPVFILRHLILLLIWNHLKCSYSARRLWSCVLKIARLAQISLSVLKNLSRDIKTIIIQ